jgi:DNA-binding NtrC family response regulator
MIARNAATLPPGLIDAELFGNVKNYPNPGMAERPGLVGEASDSTLFFDEVGELSAELQAHLLRLLDRGGEYQRLGEAKMRNANLRVLAASNRAEAELKHDLAARFPLRIQVPGLDERREDIALLLRHQVLELARDDARIRNRFFEASGNPRFDTGLIEALLLHRFTDHVRELTALAWAALLESPSETIELTDGVRTRLSARAPVVLAERPTREQVVAALELHGGRRDRAWRELGLKNRDALYRLMKEYGLIESGSGEHG